MKSHLVFCLLLFAPYLFAQEQISSNNVVLKSEIDDVNNKASRVSSLLLSFLPHQTPSGFSISNSNFGLHYSLVFNEWGFYTEIGSNFNFPSTEFDYRGKNVVHQDGTLHATEGTFLPNAIVHSLEFGGGFVYRFHSVNVFWGGSYYTYQYYQEIDLFDLDNVLVLIKDRSFAGFIPKIGFTYDYRGWALGYSISGYHPNALANSIMLGIRF
jgi:hypothetical protein